jgi:hypothetical protein
MVKVISKASTIVLQSGFWVLFALATLAVIVN